MFCHNINGIEEFARTALTYRKMLKRIQFGNLTIEGPECPICGGSESEGHKPDCDLGKLLAD
jgi:hypothetical protein